MERQQTTAKSSQSLRTNSSRKPKPQVTLQRKPQNPLLHLQRSMGNRAFGQMVQAKLTIGAPDDKYEQEADRVADEVMTMPDSAVQRAMPNGDDERSDEESVQTKPLVSKITPLVQRQTPHEEDTIHEDEPAQDGPFMQAKSWGDVVQREGESETNTPVETETSAASDVRLPPGLGGSLSLGGFANQLQLDPDLQMRQMQLALNALTPEAVARAIASMNSQNPPLQPAGGGQQQQAPVGGTSSAPQTPSQTAEPAEPREGTPGDILNAVIQTPQLAPAIENLKSQATQAAEEVWQGMGAGGRGAAIGLGVAGLSAGVFEMFRNRRLRTTVISSLSRAELGGVSVPSLLNDAVIPIPGTPLGMEFNMQEEGSHFMFGLHLDVGRILPEWMGFGSGSPSAIGGPPQAQGAEGSMLQRSAEDLTDDENVQTMLIQRQEEDEISGNGEGESAQRLCPDCENEVQRSAAASQPPDIQRLCPSCREKLQRQNSDESAFPAENVHVSDMTNRVQRQTEPEDEGEEQTAMTAQRQVDSQGNDEEETGLTGQRQVELEEESEEQTAMTVQRESETDEEVSGDEAESIQTKVSGNNATTAPANVGANISAMKGGGQPLPDGTRDFFESRFGADFGSVRIHNDNRAAETSKSISAKAFAVGNDVAFGAGQYAPNTASGQKLLAHELTHVVQQNSENKLVQRDLSPDRPSRSASARISSFGEEALELVGGLIEGLSSAVGTELEVDVIVRIPVYRALFVTGTLHLGVSHEDEGYKIKARPALGVSLGAARGEGGGFVDLLANYTVEAQAVSGRRVLKMVSLALEAEVRAMRDEPPPLLVTTLINAMLPINNVAIGALDLTDRAINFIQGEGFSSSFWPLLADGIWGSGHMEEVMAGMQVGEFAETVDELRLAGSTSGGDDGMEAGVSGFLGLGQRRRIERREGESAASEQEAMVFYSKLNVAIGAGGGEIEINVPLSSGARGGKVKFALGATFNASNLGAWNFAISAVEQLIRIGVRRLQNHLGQSGQSTQLQSASAQLENGMREIRGEFAQVGRNALWDVLSAAGVAERGFEIVAELNLETNVWEFSLASVQEMGDSAQGSGISMTRKRKLVEISTE